SIGGGRGDGRAHRSPPRPYGSVARCPGGCGGSGNAAPGCGCGGRVGGCGGTEVTGVASGLIGWGPPGTGAPETRGGTAVPPPGGGGTSPVGEYAYCRPTPRRVEASGDGRSTSARCELCPTEPLSSLWL